MSSSELEVLGLLVMVFERELLDPRWPKGIDARTSQLASLSGTPYCISMISVWESL